MSEADLMKEEIMSCFVVLMGTPFVARFLGHRLVPEFDRVKALLRVEDKFVCSTLYHLDNQLSDCKSSVVKGFKQRGWRAVFHVEPITNMHHADVNSQFLFQIFDVDVETKDGMFYCNISCLLADKCIF